ncbi:MAG: hypothetical protein CMM01_02650 [Rhodopirellula sp.]|nr:hypothetical protein [Rhodopirellula sp.]
MVIVGPRTNNVAFSIQTGASNIRKADQRELHGLCNSFHANARRPASLVLTTPLSAGHIPALAALTFGRNCT